MEFRLLGPMEVALDAGQAPELARGKERCLLAVLLMNAGQVLSSAKLISFVWDDDSRGTAEGTFRSYLSHVKSVVDATRGQAQLVARDGGYQLRVPADCVDAHRFARLRHRADVAARDGHADQAVALLCEAEALWRGPALAGLDGQWASAARAGLEEERRACVLKRVGLELDLGRHAEILGELRRLRLQYPVDEVCAAHEMTALYRSGRRADALDTYRQVRTRLVDLGIEPRPELEALHQRILCGDLPQPDVPRKPVAAGQPSRLPPQDTAFVGRAEELHALTAVGAGASRIWVISGLHGVGKTRLAIEAARRLAGEWLYLEFGANKEDRAPLDVHEALRRLLEMTGIRRSVLPRGKAELAALWQKELATRQMTIILDDVPDAASVLPLLPRNSTCRVFITARHRLHEIPDAAELALDVLPEHDAILLFRQIAGGKEDGDQGAAMAVRLCGRLPIAITLTASMLRQGGSSPVTSQPADAAGIQGLPEDTGEMSEQLRLVLDASYRALTEGEQRLFRFLGTNPCSSFTAESAAALAGMPVPATGEMITALFDRHLIEHAADDGFRLHDLLRAYAIILAKRDIAGRDRRDAERRLLGYYLRGADSADRDLYPHRRRALPKPASPPQQRSSPDSAGVSYRWLEREWRNALKAAEYAGQHEWQQPCAELAHVLAEFLNRHGYWEEAAAAHAHALRACRDLGDDTWIARALIDLSQACQRTGLRQEALAHAQEALDMYRSAGNLRGEAIAADRIGVINYYSGNFREMLAYEREARSLYAQSGDTLGEAEAVFHCGIACNELGRMGESLDHFHESLAIFEHSGNQYGAASALNSIADASLRQGYHRDALGYYQKALSMCRSAGARQKSATIMQNIGRVYLYKGHPERAMTEFRCALATFRQIRDILWQARALCDCGDAFLAMEEYEQCLVYYRQAASAAEQIGDMQVRVTALRGIADAHRESDRAEEAMHYYQDALRLAQEVGEPYQHAVILDGISKTMFRLGKASAGRIYLRQAYDLYQAAGAIEAETAELRLQVLGDPPGDEKSPPAASA